MDTLFTSATAATPTRKQKVRYGAANRKPASKNGNYIT